MSIVSTFVEILFFSRFYMILEKIIFLYEEIKKFYARFYKII